jgi:hypothetical protein
MRYRVYNDTNISKNPDYIFATYFKTKKEAVVYSKQIGNNAKVEKKIGCQWYEV